MSEIKSIVPHQCPNCQKNIYLELELAAPIVTGIMTQLDINSAKEEAIKQIKATEVSDVRKEGTIAWIGDPSTIFGPNDIDAIITEMINS